MAEPVVRDLIHYADSGNVAIAYAVLGSGPRDVVFAHGFAGNIEVELEEPFQRAFIDRMAGFSRFIVFDRRGTGLSDRPREPATLEARMDDVRAVMDAVGSESAVLFGSVEAASMCVLFAATYPERTLGLVLCNTVVRGTWLPEFPWAYTAEEWRAEVEQTRNDWGAYEQAAQTVRASAPSRANDPEFIARWARHSRLSASPGAAATLLRMMADVDVRDVLGAIRVPTLVAHAPSDVHESEYIAKRIAGARLFALSGPDAAIYLQTETLVPEVERFVAALETHEPETVLATVLFTDIVDSTSRLAELGDTAWRDLVDRHHALVRRQLANFRGHEVDTAGDGFFATFDGPLRAIKCAQAIVQGVQSNFAIGVRAGLHTGECQIVDGKLGGIAVHIGARIAALAQADEVLVSSTVKDLVAGSGLEFATRGEVELKGVPGRWQIYAALGARSAVVARAAESALAE